MKTFIVIVCFLSFKSVIATNIRVEKRKELEDVNSSKELQVPGGERQSITTEESQVPCPPHKSLHTKEDIKIMIDYRVKTLSIYNFINNSFYSKAVEVSNKHMNDFNHFRSWYRNRPGHLKHNIEDIAFVRDHIEPFVRHAANAVKQYPLLKEKYDKKLNKTNTLLKKINRYKIICENNCESKGTFRISRKSEFNGYYCTSLEELDRSIKSELVEFAKNLSSTMLDRVTHDDEVFTNKIDDLKNKLKDDALKEFGRTMYDILNLQDDYHHFVENLMRIDAESEAYKIREIYLQIDTKLLELEQRIEMYGTYCRTCNEISLRSLSLNNNRHIIFQDKESKSKDLLHHLLSLKFKEIENSTNNDYSNIFKELNSLLNNTDSKTLYVTDLKPIQDEVVDLLKKQRTNFDKLKSIISPSSLIKLVKLSSDSKQILLKIDKEVDYLNQIWPK